jgi:NADPH-dependent 2,4-dienoyl-CoA reductase/sulfur reductase-like enzyme
MRYLILGSGPAGIAAAKEARRLDKGAEIVVATEEHAAPYLRPALPDLVSGERELQAMADPQARDLEELGIRLLRGKRARRVDAEGNRVLFTDGTEEGYNFLCIATGARPVAPAALAAVPGFSLVLNSLGDAMRLRDRAMRSDHTVVYGPGYLGIEAARALRMAGNQVTWISPGPPRAGNPIPPDTEAKIAERLRSKGVKTREGVGIADVIDVDGRSCDVVTTAGEAIRCSLVVAATERLPDIGFLEGSGVETASGVRVSEYLQTNVPNIYAAGDCAEVRDIHGGGSRINFGWRSAVKQGRLAGGNMAGAEGVYIRNSEDYFGLLYGAPLRDRVK